MLGFLKNQYQHKHFFAQVNAAVQHAFHAPSSKNRTCGRIEQGDRQGQGQSLVCFRSGQGHGRGQGCRHSLLYEHEVFGLRIGIGPQVTFVIWRLIALFEKEERHVLGKEQG